MIDDDEFGPSHCGVTSRKVRFFSSTFEMDKPHDRKPSYIGYECPRCGLTAVGSNADEARNRLKALR